MYWFSSVQLIEELSLIGNIYGTNAESLERLKGGSWRKQKNRSGVTKGRRASIVCPSAVSIVSVKNICWLAPACLPSVALLVYIQKQLLAYFRKHLLVYFQKQLSVYFRKQLLAYFQKHLSRVCAPPPSPTQGMEGEEVGKELVGAIEVVQTIECSNKLY